MGANHSFYVNTIETHAHAFLPLIILAIGTVYYVQSFVRMLISNFIMSFQKVKRQEDMARRQQEIQKEAENQRKEVAERKFQERKVIKEFQGFGNFVDIRNEHANQFYLGNLYTRGFTKFGIRVLWRLQFLEL